jgi:hypothetical protein
MYQRVFVLRMTKQETAEWRDCLTRLSSTKWYGNRHVPLKCRIWIAFRSKKSRLSSTLGDMLICIKSVSICIPVGFFMIKHLIPCWGQGFLFWNILCFFPNSGYVQFGEQDLIEEACKLSETTKCVHVKPITFPQKIYKKEVPYTQKTIRYYPLLLISWDSLFVEESDGAWPAVELCPVGTECPGSLSHRHCCCFSSCQGYPALLIMKICCIFVLFLTKEKVGKPDNNLDPVVLNLCLDQPSVVDPWHFGTDPDPRIRTSDLRICFFRQWLTRWLQRVKVFLLITFYRHIYISLQR